MNAALRYGTKENTRRRKVENQQPFLGPAVAGENQEQGTASNSKQQRAPLPLSQFPTWKGVEKLRTDTNKRQAERMSSRKASLFGVGGCGPDKNWWSSARS
jgi:hypothetical protein